MLLDTVRTRSCSSFPIRPHHSRPRRVAPWWVVACVIAACAAPAGAQHVNIIVRNTGKTDLYAARAFMPTGISWFSEGWFRIPAGKSRRLDNEGSNRPIYIGFALHNDQGQFGGFHYVFKKYGTAKEFPVRGDPWRFPGLDLTSRTGGVEVAREGFDQIPFSLYLDFSANRGMVDLTFDIEARSDVRVYPIGPVVAPQPAAPAAPAAPAVPNRPPTLQDKDAVTAHLLSGYQILAWRGDAREWYGTDGKLLPDEFNPSAHAQGGKILRPARVRSAAEPAVAARVKNINAILAKKSTCALVAGVHGHKVVGGSVEIDDYGVVTVKEEHRLDLANVPRTMAQKLVVGELNFGDRNVGGYADGMDWFVKGATGTGKSCRIGVNRGSKVLSGEKGQQGVWTTALLFPVNTDEDANRIVAELRELARLFPEPKYHFWRIGDLPAAGPPAPKAAEAQPHPAQAKANAGDVEAMYQLAEAYRMGSAVAKDEAAALPWYRKAAERGHAPSMVRVGEAYASGGLVLRDDAEALRWIGAAADKGNAEGLTVLAFMHASGHCVPENHDEAERLGKLELLSGPGGVAAAYLYGHTHGWIKVPQDPARARRIIQYGADRGSAPAKAALQHLDQQAATAPAGGAGK